MKIRKKIKKKKTATYKNDRLKGGIWNFEKERNWKKELRKKRKKN